MKKTDIWRWVERFISLSIIIGMFTAWRVDQATWKVTIKNLVESDEKQETYIQNQNEINGKFLILYDYFITGSTGAGAEED